VQDDKSLFAAVMICSTKCAQCRV